MRREALLVGISENDEHEVALRYGETMLVCYALDPPRASGGAIVWVDLQLQLADRKLEPLGVEPVTTSITRDGDSFRHVLVGWLDDGLLRIGDLTFDHPDFGTTWAHFAGEQVRVWVERIEAFFG